MDISNLPLRLANTAQSKSVDPGGTPINHQKHSNDHEDGDGNAGEQSANEKECNASPEKSDETTKKIHDDDGKLDAVHKTKDDMASSAITQARTRFLETGGDSTIIHADFFPFLKSLDTFIEKVEGGVSVLRQADAEFVTVGKKRVRPDEPSYPYITKKRRVMDGDEDEDIDSQPLEDQVHDWKSKAIALQKEQNRTEDKLRIATNQLRNPDDSRDLQEQDWVTGTVQFWDTVRPAINSERRRE
ncbi:hypothetical protein CMUS01_01664 [Colletotrichum musicola]|uniref:Uncharacterized protein n=1 Tax=Colletotrichum musicola TaxID=2175873 RepID=A0A8H6NWQ1_9PEZI|nr:hypothetical protein CMUS01_01664 [Colletotrichum musicola]